MARHALTYFKENWLYLAVLAFLIAFPFLVGALTNSSPYGVQRGSRMIMIGPAVYWMSVVIEVFALAVLVMSYNLMFGFTGVVSFGHALFFGLGGYLLGLLLQYTDLSPDVGFALGVGVVLAACAVIGLGVGLISLRLRGVYFAIFTLAMAEMVWIYFGRLPLTNGEDGFALSRLPTWIDPSMSRLNLYYVGLALSAFTFWLIRRMVRSPLGTVWVGMRENEERAQALGYNTLAYKLVAIIVAGMLAGMAGILHSVLAKKIGPEILGVSYTVEALLMTIIGGAGTFTGPVIGAASIEIADTLLRDARLSIGAVTLNIGESWTTILGVLFVLVVMIFPYGVVGTWMRWRQRKR